jgi:putative transposase
LTGEHQQKHSTNSYSRFNKPVLQPPIESGQFTSWAFTQNADRYGLKISMGTIGDCPDNAMIEAFWGRMQTELLNRKSWFTRIELATAMAEYIDYFHNGKRRHSALGMLTPTEFETLQPNQVLLR